MRTKSIITLVTSLLLVGCSSDIPNIPEDKSSYADNHAASNPFHVSVGEAIKEGESLYQEIFGFTDNVWGAPLHAWVMDGIFQSFERWPDTNGQQNITHYNLYHCVWGYGKKGDGYYMWNNNEIGYSNPQQTEEGETDRPEEFFTQISLRHYPLNKKY